METNIKQRISDLREWMKRNGISAFIIPSTDPHLSEYVAPHWQSREWISGFSGSAGTCVVTCRKAGLWTDSRYFLQAASQLEGSGIELFKEMLPETPSIAQFLCSELQSGESVGIDAMVFSTQGAQNLEKELKGAGISLKNAGDPMAILWKGRPEISEDPLFPLDMAFAGKSTVQKLQEIRGEVYKAGAEALFVSALDDIAWTLNMRGSDVHCNPVFVSYLYIDKEQTHLFVNPKKVPSDVKNLLQADNILLHPYQEAENFLLQLHDKRILLDLPKTNAAIYAAACAHCRVIAGASPICLMKSIKNTTEQEGFRHAMTRDGIAMVKFLKWLKPAVEAGGETELSIDRKLCSLRAEQANFRGISFDTIAGYGAHGAIVHYEPTPETDIPIKPEGLLLLDSGGQYLDGTTDLTRTIALGPTTEEERIDFTLVLKGFLQLMNVVFPDGTCGTQLDVLARQSMWKAGINYLHGTGHGVGSFLCVHEGPHQIRMNHMPTILKPGMTLTDEPGIYKAGKHGVRTENTLLIVPAQETEFGNFYRFEPLTLCPIDKAPIIKEMLSTEEVQWFNEYQQLVYERLAPHLDEEERIWLKEATSAL
ncbi:MAG: aminopeptidase P family protein [Mediterranea sp.]|nr:aminopeptidase P family protein [Mediterranea sp.]